MSQAPGNTAENTAISTSGLELRFSDGTEAVHGIDLSIAQGEIFGFLGPNGAGKTTTVRMLTTLLKPTGGSAQIMGLDVVRRPSEVRKVIGAALQTAGLNPMATGFELLEMHARLFGVRGRTATSRANELLEIVGLDKDATRLIRGYSGGMRRRLDLAVALVHKPKVLFLDEPTTGLDPASRATIWEQVRTLRKDHSTTVFLTTQYLEEADALADRIAIIDDGSIVREGTPLSLKRSVSRDRIEVHATWHSTAPEVNQHRVRTLIAEAPDVEFADLVDDTWVVSATDSEASLANIIRIFQSCDATIHSVRTASPTLDDVFVSVTGNGGSA